MKKKWLFTLLFCLLLFAILGEWMIQKQTVTPVVQEFPSVITSLVKQKNLQNWQVVALPKYNADKKTWTYTAKATYQGDTPVTNVLLKVGENASSTNLLSHNNYISIGNLPLTVGKSVEVAVMWQDQKGITQTGAGTFEMKYQ